MRVTIVTAVTFLAAFAFGATVYAADVSNLLNKANVMNYEEIQMAKIAKSKAGDNQALQTYAETLKSDHEANEDAVTALSRQRDVKIEGTPADIENKQNAMDQLSGAQFNEAFLTDEIKDHQKALSYFRTARSEFRHDRDTEIYIDQTLPILRAHLDMAQNLHREFAMGSSENPENNKRQ